MVRINEDTIETKSYHHIDNGGPKIILETTVQFEDNYPEDKNKQTSLKISSQYYGYPDISVKFCLHGQDEVAILTAFKNAIEQHIEKIR